MLVSCGEGKSAVAKDNQLFTFCHGDDGDPVTRENSWGYRETLTNLVSFPHNVRSLSCGEMMAVVTENDDLYYCHPDSPPDRLEKGVSTVSCGRKWLAWINNSKELWVMEGIMNRLVFYQVSQVSCGGYHLGFITITGELYMMGMNNHGQLGNGKSGPDEKEDAPVKVMESVVQVSCGLYHTLVLNSKGEVFSFGNGRFNKLGTGRGDLGYHENTPYKIPLSEEIKGLSSGKSHNFLITKSGDICAFGFDGYGLLGKISCKEDYSIVNWKVRGVISVSCGNENSLFSTEGGEVYFVGSGHPRALEDKTWVDITPELLEVFDRKVVGNVKN
jgi:alpha-tubulin suppressor-like RCC1 family protein